MTGFTPDAARRIIEATRFVERSSRNPHGPFLRTPTPSLTGFYARITDGDGYKYSFEALEPQEDGELEVNDDWITGDHTADKGYAVSTDKSEYVLMDSVVWLEPARNQDYYLFHYRPGLQLAKLAENDEISKREGSTAGTGEVTIVEFDPDSETFEDKEEINVFNFMTTEVDADDDDRFVFVSYCNGVWWLSGADCG